jgi:hypothetical protein
MDEKQKQSLNRKKEIIRALQDEVDRETPTPCRSFVLCDRTCYCLLHKGILSQVEDTGEPIFSCTHCTNTYTHDEIRKGIIEQEPE